MKNVIGQKLANRRLMLHEWQRMSIVLLMLALLIVGASIVACSTSSTQSQHPGSTMTPAQTATSAAQQLYSQVTGKQPDVSDSLSASSGFMVQDPPNCTFSNGTFHVKNTMPRNYIWCISLSTTASNFAFQVQMTTVSGDRGGIMFRIDNAATKYYRFDIGQDGSYALHLSTSLSSSEQLLLSGFSPVIKTGHGQTNMIAVIANGNSLSFFVNQQFITSKSNSTLASGNIGFIADSISNSPTDVAYSNIQLWKL